MTPVYPRFKPHHQGLKKRHIRPTKNGRTSAVDFEQHPMMTDNDHISHRLWEDTAQPA